ncbi:thiamine pyrophosphate-binding protein [Brevibacillus sp. WF146]|uniref:thiamine pyrophosphate-binding protein n=1 Tax=Brevibacillus sp. WF146 TaxID=319501 RepID=UPI00222733EC|nr:thiamine pyrophosphate-binding protein [Brevibacillus sp. WF146]UYZ11953.1 thiamine pyrophosphate-binding protein [Brevibacillus sp. WF146]
MQVAQYITEQLAAWGVTRIYGVAGDAILPWLDALGKQRQIRYVACRHESAAALMASAEAKLTGKPAVCTATSGPGTIQLLNGLADAQTDRAPVVAITGQVETYRLGGEYKQYVPQEDVIRPISRYTTTVAHPEAIGAVLQRAFVTAASQQGVAHLAVCKDVFSRTTGCPLIPALPRQASGLRADRGDVEQAAEWMGRAKKPLMLLGVGARGVADACRRLAEQAGAGVLVSLGAKGVVEESHPLMLGGLGEGGSRAGLDALAAADLLVILGASWFPQAFIPAGVPVVQVDRLPEAIHFHPDLFSVTANLEEVLPLWMRRLENKRPDPDWLARVERWHAAFWQETEQAVAAGPDQPVTPEALMHALSRAVDDDAVITLDTGEHTIWFNRAFRAVRQRPLFSGKWRTMGYGLPAAIAAKLNQPERQVVCVTGDGGLQMCLSELMTAVEQKTAFPLIVVNNGTLGLEEWKMTQAGLVPFGTRLQNPDFVQWARACGVPARSVRSRGELASALTEACASDRLTLLDVHCTLPTLTERKREIPFQAQASSVYNERKI